MPATAHQRTREIDFSLPFFPVHLTPLALVPSWSRLSDAQQLRYSQWYALYHNEQTVFFEELLATTLLPAFYRRPDLIGDDLAEDLRRFEEEERGHSQWFRELNHRVDPARFSLEAGSYALVRASPQMKRMAQWLAQRPFAFPLWIWLVLLQEERSIAVSKECLAAGEGLEPSFAAVHRRHMADEVDHVRWDLALIERVWLPMPKWKRRLQARLFGWMMAEFFTAPKRSAKAVVLALTGEFSDLQPLEAQLLGDLADLATSIPFHATLYSRETTPRCFALFDELPEFYDIGRSLPAYQRP